MSIRKAYKFRIYPTEKQQGSLTIQFGHTRFVYNWGLATRKNHHKETGQGLSYNGTAKRLTQLKRQPELEWLKQADSQVLQQKLKDLDRAYRNFFEKRASYPKFKSKHGKQTIRYPQRFKIEGSRIYLPKVGWVRCVLHRSIEGRMKNCTVSKTKSGRYFVSIQCEVETEAVVPMGRRVGIDLGLIHFAVLSTGEKVVSPRYLRKSEKKLVRLQRQLS